METSIAGIIQQHLKGLLIKMRLALALSLIPRNEYTHIYTVIRVLCYLPPLDATGVRKTVFLPRLPLRQHWVFNRLSGE